MNRRRLWVGYRLLKWRRRATLSTSGCGAPVGGSTARTEPGSGLRLHWSNSFRIETVTAEAGAGRLRGSDAERHWGGQDITTKTLQTGRKIQKRDCCLGLSSKTERPPSDGEIASSWAMTASKSASGSSWVSVARTKLSRRRKPSSLSLSPTFAVSSAVRRRFKDSS